ncbi:hypothetical protein [Streptomyces sp. NPDC014894]|uniref:hypothetical protein n=1 Tax=Streptomyces sp. NPDC014894 TaxID=3364931 RepID=UPI0036F4B925
MGLRGAAREEMHGAAFRAANAVTLGMELVAVVVAVAFAYPWGRRLPAWAVLGPMWVGAGLLGPILLGVPLGMAIQSAVGGSAVPDGDGGGAGPELSGWVFGVVYGGFTVQAVTLIWAFALYARDRWPTAFVSRAHGTPDGKPQAATRALQLLLVRGASLVAAVAGVAQIVQALGGDGSLTAAQRTFVCVGGVVALCGTAGALRLVRGRGPGRSAPALAAAWVGTGHLLAGGVFASGVGGVAGAVSVFGGCAGLLLAVACLLTLLESDRDGERDGDRDGGPRPGLAPPPGALY